MNKFNLIVTLVAISSILGGCASSQLAPQISYDCYHIYWLDGGDQEFYQLKFNSSCSEAFIEKVDPDNHSTDERLKFFRVHPNKLLWSTESGIELWPSNLNWELGDEAELLSPADTKRRLVTALTLELVNAWEFKACGLENSTEKSPPEVCVSD